MRTPPVHLFLCTACAASGTLPSSSDSGVVVTGPGPADAPGRPQDSAASETATVQLFINELMPSNTGSLERDGDTPDWLELFNPAEADVALDGFTVTDDLELPRKAVLSGGLVVPASGFLVLYASGRGPSEGASVEELPFQLSSEGEELAVFFPDGTPADQVQFGAVPSNLALARLTDGGQTWHVTASSTPGEPNGPE